MVMNFLGDCKVFLYFSLCNYDLIETNYRLHLNETIYIKYMQYFKIGKRENFILGCLIRFIISALTLFLINNLYYYYPHEIL
jgi:hypothetical protein